LIFLRRYCPLNKDGAYNRGASLSELKNHRNAAGNYPVPCRPVILCHPPLAEEPVLAEIRRLEAEAARLRARYNARNKYVAIGTYNTPPPFRAFGMSSISSSRDSASPPRRGLFANGALLFVGRIALAT
jgi:hypothetical protein